MKDLIERVKQECATAYFAAGDTGLYPKDFLTYGCTPEESDTLHYLCCHIEEHYFKFNPFLPKGFRELMYDGSTHKNLEINQIFIAHYRVNLKVLERKLKEIESYDSEFNASKEMSEFIEKYDPATVIWSFTRRSGILPSIIGRGEISQEIMDDIKSDEDNVFTFFNEMVSPISILYKEIEQIHIYDLLGKPKEIHFKL